MSIPKPGSWIKPPVLTVGPEVPLEVGTPIKKAPTKKPFVLRPHLTDRPLQGNPELSELKTQMDTTNPKKGKK